MTKDVIALTRRMPDALSILAGLLAGGPDLLVETAGEGAVVQLCDAEGRPLVSIEVPLLLQVQGEAARLLGPDVEPPGDGPAWWVEARAAAGVPQAEQLAGAFAARLTMLLGGRVWPPDAPGTVGAARPVDVSGITAVPAPAAAQPAVDMLTDRAAVVLQDRPVVPMTSWLSEALRATVDSDRSLQIVTPPHCRLSLPTRMLLQSTPSRWVVQDERCGYYDGLTGAVLRWQDDAFSPARDESGETPVAEAFAEVRPSGERQLVVSFRTLHPPRADLVLGGALEAAWQALAGGPPASWGTSEPAGLAWSRRQLTELAYERAPRPTWTVVVGAPNRPAVATLRVIRTPEGVEEDITLTIGYGPGEKPALEALPELADELVTRHGLKTMLCQLRAARRDLSTPPHFEHPPLPYAFVLGPAEGREAGRDTASRTPLKERPVRLGPNARPGFYYPLGDGESAESWYALEQLMRHLRGAPPA
ncbi:DUF6177 family protein [Streptomyces sp. NBC_00053]|uniref:DUF6177 family protein n=1 Tax=unclassified Streptomyces TaxID=2593676 RepID=UPI000F5BD9D3|nr:MULTISPECIES: DUF6177 family protein [unclassified Streptomyces]WSG51763.1 DUF6177 family protein [Streptomyces sp. NBC_01732]WSX02419.1 DUF6177 family protein [Streptomyces sp. NBC_00987]MCX5501502.1 DUF6177 family protein [Streptomyces sp. NBC_00052]MCX5549963.1 DUF6177 family protein [Streptomyces sp. NBC_00051]RPK69011.1 hypothetical protein EES42_20020 [Streptomyces sp. ADI95-17]